MIKIRNLASIQRIKNIVPIENADKIEIVEILGWKAIVEKGIHHTNELVVFCEIDSILPEIPEFEFLRTKNFRIKTIKLRGIYSQGLCLPLSILNKFKYENDVRENIIYNFKEGQDVTTLMKIKKYELEIPSHMTGIIKGQFPNFLMKSDQTRVQILQDVLDKYKDYKFVITEKCHGTSVTFYTNNGEFGVCSRNLELKESDNNTIWKFVKENKIKEKLIKLNTNIALQGEMIGPKISGNHYKLKEVTVLFFDVFDINSFKNLDPKEAYALIRYLELKTVPILNTEFIMIDDMNILINMAFGNSIVGNSNVKREGIVFRTIEETIDNNFQELHRGRVSFKSINQEFLLKNEE